jgi:branched-chain amino acid transport system permease protein
MDWHGILSQSLQQGLGPVAAVYCLAAIGLNIHFGYTGLLNFGQAGFMAIGGYAVSSFVATWGLSFWVGCVVALGATALLALALGVPTLRLRADYLAIVTIAAAEIIRQTIGSVTLLKYFGGQDGLQGFNQSFASLNPFSSSVGIPGVVSWRAYDFWTLLVCWFLVALSCLMTWALMRSPWGRVLKSIREDEDAVRSLGKNVTMLKTQSLVIGGVFAAFGGVVNVLATSVSADGMGRTLTFQLYTCLLLGGAATVFGPILGTLLYFFVTITIRDALKFFGAGVVSDQQAAQIIWVVVGIGLMLLVIFRPQGILGNKRELTFVA